MSFGLNAESVEYNLEYNCSTNSGRKSRPEQPILALYVEKLLTKKKIKIMEEIKEKVGFTFEEFMSMMIEAIDRANQKKFLLRLKLSILSRKLCQEVFYVTDRKGEIKRSYEITEAKVVKGTEWMSLRLKVKFREEIYSRKRITCKTRVRFQDLAVLEKKLGRALY